LRYRGREKAALTQLEFKVKSMINDPLPEGEGDMLGMKVLRGIYVH